MHTELGRLVDHDIRSLSFHYSYTLVGQLKPVDWDDDAPISDQADVGALYRVHGARYHE